MGKIVGYKLLLYRILFLSWQYENGKMKFSIIKNKGYDGLCVMIPSEALNPKKHMLVTSGGIMMNVLSVIFMQFILIFATTEFIKITILLCNFTTLFIIIYNSLLISIGNYNSDGKIFFALLSKSKFGENLIKITLCSTEVSAGVKPKDLNIVDFDIDDKASKMLNIQLYLLKLLKALDSKDLEKLKEMVHRIECNLENISDPVLPGYYNELIYYYSAINFNAEKATLYYDKTKKLLLKDNDINGQRVLASYEYYINNDIESARKCCTDGLKVADKFPIKGQAKMEVDLINDLLNNID